MRAFPVLNRVDISKYWNARQKYRKYRDTIQNHKSKSRLHYAETFKHMGEKDEVALFQKAHNNDLFNTEQVS